VRYYKRNQFQSVHTKGGKIPMNAQSKEKGFTIIEVVLVLAIAGLIFLMVFIALPALQRNQRDTQRRNDVGRVQTALASYSSANRGAVPTTPAAWTSFNTQFLAVGGDSFIDPAGAVGSATTYEFTPRPATTAVGAFSSDAGVGLTQNRMFYTNNAICNPADSTLAQTAGSRKVAIRIALEGGGTYCVNN